MSVAIKRSEVLSEDTLMIETADGRAWRGLFGVLASADRLNVVGKAGGCGQPGSLMQNELFYDVCETIKAICANTGASRLISATIDRMGRLKVSFTAQTKNARGIVVSEETIVAILDETVPEDKVGQFATRREVFELRSELRECMQLCARMSDDLQFVTDSGSTQLLSRRSPFARSIYEVWRAGAPLVVPILFSHQAKGPTEYYALFPMAKLDEGVRRWRISRVDYYVVQFLRVKVSTAKAEECRYPACSNNPPEVHYCCGCGDIYGDRPRLFVLNHTATAQYVEQRGGVTAGPAVWPEFAPTDSWANSLMAYFGVFRRDMSAVLELSRVQSARTDIAWE